MSSPLQVIPPSAPPSLPTAPNSRPGRPKLRVVPPLRSTAPRAPFVLLVLGLLAGGLVGLLLLNTMVAQQAFRAYDLKRQAAALSLQEQTLRREVEQAAAPAELARKAVALGMVPAGEPRFLRLPDGTVLGPQPGEDVGPKVALTPSSTPGVDGQSGPRVAPSATASAPLARASSTPSASADRPKARSSRAAPSPRVSAPRSQSSPVPSPAGTP